MKKSHIFSMILFLAILLLLSGCSLISGQPGQTTGTDAESTAEVSASGTSEAPEPTDETETGDPIPSDTVTETETETEAETEPEPHEHVYSLTETIAATCTEYGTEIYHCDICGKEKVTVIMPLRHKNEHFAAKKPTCTEDGWNAYDVCTRCGKSTFELIPALGHDYDVTLEITKSDIPMCGQFHCNRCGEEHRATVTPADVGIAILNITGHLEDAIYDNGNKPKINVTATYMDEYKTFTAPATIKVQGATSAWRYEKLNYTIQFFNADGSKNKVRMVSEWGKHSKYCLKANWVDASHSRNIASARIYNEIIHDRDKDDVLSELWNGGTTDGYPILIYSNGVFHGLYTLNIPKGDWMFGMDDDIDSPQAIMEGNNWTDSVALRTDVDNSWTIEYCSTEDTEWVIDSFNEMIHFLNNNTGENFKKGISKYIDVDRAIDNFLYTVVMRAWDNRSRNILWLTYDGVQWIPQCYDMDGTWGMDWSGKNYDSPETLPLKEMKDHNVLWKRLYECYHDEIIARYAELRQDILTLANVEKHFTDVISQFPEAAYAAERAKWAGIPGLGKNNLDQILEFAKKRFLYLDSRYGFHFDP